MPSYWLPGCRRGGAGVQRVLARVRPRHVREPQRAPVVDGDARVVQVLQVAVRRLERKIAAYRRNILRFMITMEKLMLSQMITMKKLMLSQMITMKKLMLSQMITMKLLMLSQMITMKKLMFRPNSAILAQTVVMKLW